MTSQLKKLEKSQVEITVEISYVEAEPYLKKAAAKLAEEFKIDGFRPGKAPYEVIKQKAGEMAILEAALDDIINQTFNQVLVEQKIVTIGQPQINLEKLAPGNPIVYKAVVALLPAVKVGDFGNLTLKKEKTEVKDEAVDRVLQDLQKLRAQETKVERPAQTGDKLIIDFSVLQDQVVIDGGAEKNYPIVIGENRFIPGFEEQLVGLTAGGEKEFDLKFPEKYFQKNLAGKTCHFKVKCQEVKEVKLPLVNDEFAQTISGGHFKTALELKDNIKKNLIAEAEAKQDQRLEAEMFDRLISPAQFEEIPEVLKANEVKKMIGELEMSVTGQGFKFEDYLKSINKTVEVLEKELLPEAEKRVKIALFCREIYQQNNFSVSQEEIDQEIEHLSQHYPDRPEVKNQFSSPQYREYLKNVLGNQKVVDYLKGKIIK